MYPWELDNFIKQHDNKLGGDDLIKAISVIENPQLNHIIFHPENSSYEMWDYDGNYYQFTAEPLQEYQKKILTRKKER